MLIDRNKKKTFIVAFEEQGTQVNGPITNNILYELTEQFLAHEKKDFGIPPPILFV